MSEENVFDFSVLVPVYNTEKTLPRALQSIQSQNYEKTQVVLVNDCSPASEECEEIVKRFSSLKIKYVKHEKNKGLYEARITAASQADGKYSLFLDSDDELEAGTLQNLSQYLKKDCDYIQFPSKALGGKEEERNFWQSFTLNRFTSILDLLEDKIPHNMCLKCFKTELLKKVYFELPHFYCYFAEDYFQSAIIEYYAKKREFCDKAFYVYHMEIGVTGEKSYGNADKIQKMLSSLSGIQQNLTAFFKDKNEELFEKKVNEYIFLQHLLIIAKAKSREIKRLVKESPSLKEVKKHLPASFCLRKTFLNNLKIFVKALLPASIWKALKKMRNRKKFQG